MSSQTDRDRRFALAEEALGEYFARVEQGELLTFDGWAARHPGIADELRELHCVCELLRQPAGSRPTNGKELRDDVHAMNAALESLRHSANRYRDYDIEAVPIAEGGMGTVFAAHDRTLGRSLAVKALRRRDGSAASESRRVTRFLEEARITSQLDHPGIVPVYEIGLDASHRPYFTMKRVCGQTFARVLERVAAGDRQWSQTRALDVLLRVCEAVAFAHQNGVIHRDLKPANVMVGDFGEVYVMDWGLARVLEALENEKAPHAAAIETMRGDVPNDLDHAEAYWTQDGEVIGTPAYMAPEQAVARRAEIGRHSDVYSVGAMLYQLLSGRSPYSEPRGTPPARVVLARVAAGPPDPLQRIAGSVPGELIAICEKAMHRDWRRRYADMSALSEDLSAFLHGRVVRAYEAGAWAESRKWLRRNKALAAALAGAIAFLIGGSITSLVYAGEAREHAARAQANAEEALRNAGTANLARDRADESAAVALRNEEAAKRSEAKARASEQCAKRVTEFVQTALVRSDPNQGGAQQYLVIDAMEQAMSELESGALSDDPETEASLQATIARILHGNGRPEDALRLAEKSLDTREQLFGGDHPDVDSSLNDVACCLQALGRGAEALPQLEAALRMSQRLHEGDHRDTATCLNNVALCLDTLGRSAPALLKHEAALAMRQRLFEGDHEDVAQSLNNVGLCLASLGKNAAALPKFQAALDMNRRLHAGDHPYVATSLHNVATCLGCIGRSAEALPLCADALQMSQRLYQRDHPCVAASLSGFASALGDLGRRSEALPMHEAALEMRRRLFAGDHPEIAVSLNNVAVCLDGMARSAEALPLFEAALEMNERLHPGDHPNVATCLNGVAACLDALGRRAEALSKYEATLQMRRRLFAAEHVDVAISLNNVAGCLEALGRADDALPYYEEALRTCERLFPGDHPSVALCLVNVAHCLDSLAQSAGARDYAERADAMAARILPDGHPTRARCAAELQRIRDALARAPRAAVPASKE